MNSSVNFDCPLCGQNLEAPVGMAGHGIECPACEGKIIIPPPGGKAQPIIEDSPRIAAEEQAPAVAEEPPATDAGEEPADAGSVRKQEPEAAPPAQGKKRIVMRRAGGKAAKRQMPARAPAPASSPAPAANMRQPGISEKRRTTALLLLLFLGPLGIHRMYVGKIGTGLLFMITWGGLTIWWMVDLVLITSGSFRDKQGRLVKQW